MTDWVEFFRIISIASGSDNAPHMPYQLAACLDDYHQNAAAAEHNMLPLSGGRGDLDKSELAAIFIEESAE